MKTLSINISGEQVNTLQTLLNKKGANLTVSGVFDEATLEAVKAFQKKQGLHVDGIVGDATWKVLEKESIVSTITAGITDYLLQTNEYFAELHPKTTIYLHHTAGAYRPDYTIDWWEKDNKKRKLNRVATSFVIGGKTEKDDSFDGVTYRCFNEKYWAHHLGLKDKHNNVSSENNKKFNIQSIGIEICNYGYLEKEEDKYFYKDGAGKLKEIPSEEVCVLNKPWRGHQYFHQYTEKQLAECRRLILELARVYDIELGEVKYSRDWFDLKYDAIVGAPGLWTHCNVRYDKTDCYPSPALIDMLNSLHDETPQSRGFNTEERLPTHQIIKRNFTPDEWSKRETLIENYTKGEL